MIVVADTSPTNYLILIGHIELLPKIFGEAQVPQAIIDELLDVGAPRVVTDGLSNPPSWLTIRTTNFPPDPLLDRLDRGERDAILLAESIGAERLIIDDLDALLRKLLASETKTPKPVSSWRNWRGSTNKSVPDYTFAFLAFAQRAF